MKEKILSFPPPLPLNFFQRKFKLNEFFSNKKNYFDEMCLRLCVVKAGKLSLDFTLAVNCN